LGQAVLAALCAATILLPAGCKPGGAPAGTPPAGGGGPKGPAPVKIGEVTQQSVPVQLAAVGSVEPIQTVQIKAQVSGQVMEVRFTEGDLVQKDQVLFVIDKRPYEVALKQAEANLSKAQAQLEQAKAMTAKDKAQAERLKATFARDQGLAGKGMLSKEEFDRSRADFQAAEAAVAADEANAGAGVEAIEAARTAIDQAKLQLEYCTITAPLTGRTGAVAAKAGNLVRTGDMAPMVTINQIAPIRVSFSVPERQLAELKRRMTEGAIGVDALFDGDATPCNGTLTFVDNTVDATTGTIVLKATFDNADSRLWPGQFVRVLVNVSVQADAVVAPGKAVQIGQKGSYVYVVTADMKAEMRPVKTGNTQKDMTVILEGLKPGEKVVTDGQFVLAPGVEVKDAAAAPAAAPAAGAPAK
jgi:multidrug efflux system membrane fusion protein